MHHILFICITMSERPFFFPSKEETDLSEGHFAVVATHVLDEGLVLSQIYFGFK